MSDSNLPAFSEDEAAALVGKTIIIGITFQDHEEKFLGQEQFFGTIVRANRAEGIVIRLTSGEEKKLPPHLEALEPAPKGEYRFRATGETVVDPDLKTVWTLTKPKPTLEQPGPGQ